MPDLVAFQQRWPEIELRVDSSYQIADLAKPTSPFGPCSAASAPINTSPVRKAATAYQAIYAEGEGWFGWQGEREDRPWIRETPFPDLPRRGAFNDAALRRGACEAGMGRSLLPCFFAEPTIRRRSEPTPHFDL